MKFPEKYIKRGEFTLHSGEKSNIFYDVNALLTNQEYVEEIIKHIPPSEHYVGIATGGAILAAILAYKRNVLFSMIKDKELKGKQPKSNYILIDDVTTTEASIKEALQIIGSEPNKIIVVVDRRKQKTLALEAIYEI